VGVHFSSAPSLLLHPLLLILLLDDISCSSRLCFIIGKESESK
jgi:hypothetical protein